MSVGSDNYHAEVVFEKDGHLRFYTLGKDETKSISIESQTLNAHAKQDGADKSHEMELKPAPQKDDPKGKASLFAGKLPAELIGKKVTVTVVGLKIEGETFRVEFSSEVGNHGDHKEHKDHKKDEKEHKDHKKDHAKTSAIENEIKEARATLSPEDRKLVDAQEWCVVMTDNRLGEMGVPFKLLVKDQPVFVCCKGCQRKALADPDKTLAKLEEFKAKLRGSSRALSRLATKCRTSRSRRWTVRASSLASYRRMRSSRRRESLSCRSGAPPAIAAAMWRDNLQSLPRITLDRLPSLRSMRMLMITHRAFSLLSRKMA